MEKKVINFIRQSNYVIVIFALMLIGSVVSLMTKGLNYGIDFKGGILIEVKTTNSMTEEESRKVKEDALKKAKEVITKLGEGKSFEELAKEYSDEKVCKMINGVLDKVYHSKDKDE